MDLQRTFTFRNSKQTYTGIPIIAANMDTTGTFEMAQVLSKVSEEKNKINKKYICFISYGCGFISRLLLFKLKICGKKLEKDNNG